MTQQILSSARSHRSGGLTAAAPVILAAAGRGARSTRETIAALGGLILAALAYRQAFNRMASHGAGDPFDAPVLWADNSAKAWDQAWRSSEQAGLWRLATGVGVLSIALAFCAAVARMLI